MKNKILLFLLIISHIAIGQTSVPDTNTFSLQDVKTSVESHCSCTVNSLSSAFSNSNDSYFDPAYKGSKDRLSNFRNYTPSLYVDIIYMETTSTDSNWYVSVPNTGSTLRWTVTGAVTQVTDSNSPYFNFSTPGTKYITISDINSGSGLSSQIYLIGDVIRFDVLHILSNITSLQGYFNGTITTLNISLLPNLQALGMTDQNISSIDLSANTDLRAIGLSRNKITSIDLSYFPNLFSIFISSNLLSSINTQYNPDLTTLDISGNSGITSIDISSNTLLKNLYVSDTGLSSLSVTYNTQLELLHALRVNISSLTLSTNVNLVELYINDTAISSISLTTNVNLRELLVSNTNISSINISTNTALQRLDMSSTNISSIDISNNINLLYVNLGGTNINSCDVSYNSELIDFRIPGCSFTSAAMDDILSQLISFNKAGSYWDSGGQTTGQTPDSSLLSQLDAIWGTVFY